MSKIINKKIKKIALLRALQVGDLLCTIPAVRALRSSFPDSEITILSLPWQKFLTERFPQYFNHFTDFPGWPGLPEQEIDPKKVVKFLEKIQQEKFDLIIQMQGSGTFANEFVALSNATYTAGFYAANGFKPNTDLFTLYPDSGNEIHRWLKLMDFLGIPPKGDALEFPILDSDLAELNALGLNLEPQTYVCIHPGANDTMRRWSPEYFAQAADICAEKGHTVLLTGVKQEAALTSAIIKSMKHKALDLAGKTSLGAVAALIKNARLLIANNTGVIHIAAAVHTPSVIILLHADAQRWSPLNTSLHKTIEWEQNPHIDIVLQTIKQSLSSY